MPIPLAIYAIATLVALAAGAIAGRRRKRVGPVPSPAAVSASPRSAAPASTADISELVKPEVFAAFPAWASKWEGNVPTMYRDIIGLVTTGQGNMIDNSKGAITAEGLALPWLKPNGDRATEDEIRAEFSRVKALPSGRAYAAGSFRSPAVELHLEQDGIDQLVRAHSAGDARALIKTFPDFPTFPAPAQQAVLDLAWGRGAFCWPKFPELTRAITARDWTAAAAAVGDPAARPARTEARAELFRAAAASS